ncbi:hypothetical protein R0131_06210 [Clostridium sp. AL.422]|uniref:hypothetical protein n=1 Tax=Clostridium TaxID=1485 RepID=UPI00293DF593|nr:MULTISPECIES: hypothetical protein [unclassified Clostridium]MDV4150424.1 hypothetical protein [Clostridium sp. AL.422]
MDKDAYAKAILNINEKLILFLFFCIVIISQGIRGYLNNLTGTIILNYHIIPIAIIIFIFVSKNNKFSKSSIIIFISIGSIIFIGYIKNRYSLSDLFRTVIGFIAPLIILLLDYRQIRMNLIFPKIVKSLNIFIYVAFIAQVFMSINIGRTGGIIGHPLTAGWYYAIFISFNIIFNKFFKRKSDALIILDIIIALIGTVLAAGRISLFSVLLLSVIYAFSCCRRRSIPYFILPLIIIIFLTTPIVDKYIWDKFKEAAAWGDVTNGRLLGIREMQFYNRYPSFLIGRGIGNSNYVSQYVLGVVNFENPILMFSYDYGIFSTILLIILVILKPIINFIRERNYIITIAFIPLLIIPFTYNGLAETVGIFIILIFIIYIFLSLNSYISTKKHIR